MSNCSNCESITLFKGSDGRTIYNGSGAPTLNTANVGDFYIDTTSWLIYGPYTGTSWGAGTSLVGASGTNGLPGATGPQGVYGGFSSEWDFDSNTGSGTGSGEFRFDNASPGSATSLYVNKINVDTTDLTAFLTSWQNSGNFGLVRISKINDSNVFWMGSIDDIAIGGTEIVYPVTSILSNGTFADGDNYVVSFVRTGDAGPTGGAVNIMGAYNNATGFGSPATGETTALSVPLYANELSDNGDELEIDIFLTYASNDPVDLILRIGTGQELQYRLVNSDNDTRIIKAKMARIDATNQLWTLSSIGKTEFSVTSVQEITSGTSTYNLATPATFTISLNNPGGAAVANAIRIKKAVVYKNKI